MSGILVPTPANKAPDWTDFAIQVERLKKGFFGIEFTTLVDGVTPPAIKAGSWIEVDGAMYKFVGDDEVITGWAGIANSTVCYVKVIPDGDDITAEFTDVAPTYSALKKSWYDGDDRYILWLYKDSTPEYTQMLPEDRIDKANRTPEGIIVAQIPGYFGDDANAGYTPVAIPLYETWKKCDGSILYDPLSVIFNVEDPARHLPNLTDDRFLMGDTFAAIGGIGGASSMAHTHGFTQPSAHATHNHQWHDVNAGTKQVLATQTNDPYAKLYNSAGTPYDIPVGGFLSVDAFTNKVGLTNNHVGGSVNAVVGNTDNRPKYLACQYLMKVRA